MLYHVVLLKEPSDLSLEARQQLLGAFEHAIREISTVRKVHLGRRVRLGTIYEGQMPDIADHAIIIEFDNVAGLQAYLEHPAHDELSQRFAETIVAPLIMDFEAVGLDSLKKPLPPLK